jgi:hypothetical protein
MPDTARGWGVDPMNPRQRSTPPPRTWRATCAVRRLRERAARLQRRAGRDRALEVVRRDQHYVATILGGKDAGEDTDATASSKRRQLIDRHHDARRRPPPRASTTAPRARSWSRPSWIRRAPIRSPSRCGRASCATSRRRRSPTRRRSTAPSEVQGHRHLRRAHRRRAGHVGRVHQPARDLRLAGLRRRPGQPPRRLARVAARAHGVHRRLANGEVEGETPGWDTADRGERYDYLSGLNSGSPKHEVRLPCPGSATDTEKVYIEEREVYLAFGSAYESQKARKQANVDWLVVRRKKLWHLMQTSPRATRPTTARRATTPVHRHAPRRGLRGMGGDAQQVGRPAEHRRRPRRLHGLVQVAPRRLGEPARVQPGRPAARRLAEPRLRLIGRAVVRLLLGLLGVGQRRQRLGHGWLREQHRAGQAGRGHLSRLHDRRDAGPARRSLLHRRQSHRRRALRRLHVRAIPSYEGNTSPGSEGSQYNGGCVAQRTRSMSGDGVTGFGLVRFDE